MLIKDVPNGILILWRDGCDTLHIGRTSTETQVDTMGDGSLSPVARRGVFQDDGLICWPYETRPCIPLVNHNDTTLCLASTTLFVEMLRECETGLKDILPIE